MQPSVSKEILYFQTLSEDEKSDYIIKARTSRAVMVAAGAVLTAMVTERAVEAVREVVRGVSRLNDPLNLSCEPNDTYFDPPVSGSEQMILHDH